MTTGDYRIVTTNSARKVEMLLMQFQVVQINVLIDAIKAANRRLISYRQGFFNESYDNEDY